MCLPHISNLGLAETQTKACDQPVKPGLLISCAFPSERLRFILETSWTQNKVLHLKTSRSPIETILVQLLLSWTSMFSKKAVIYIFVEIGGFSISALTCSYIPPVACRISGVADATSYNLTQDI